MQAISATKRHNRPLLESLKIRILTPDSQSLVTTNGWLTLVISLLKCMYKLKNTFLVYMFNYIEFRVFKIFINKYSKIFLEHWYFHLLIAKYTLLICAKSQCYCNNFVHFNTILLFHFHIMDIALKSVPYLWCIFLAYLPVSILKQWEIILFYKLLF